MLVSPDTGIISAYELQQAGPRGARALPSSLGRGVIAGSGHHCEAEAQAGAGSGHLAGSFLDLLGCELLLKGRSGGCGLAAVDHLDGFLNGS